MSSDVIGSEKDIFPDNYDRLLRAAAKKYGLSPQMVKAVAANESMVGKFTQLESIGGTTGIMHIKLSTARDLVPTLTQAELNRPEVDIDLGVRYLKKMWDRYSKFDPITRTRYAVMAYNGGPGRMDEIIKKGEGAVANESWFKNMTTYHSRYSKHYSQLIA